MTYRQVGTNSFTVKYYVEKFILDMNTMKIIRVDEYRDKKKINRPAGSLFSVDGEIYRVAQNAVVHMESRSLCIRQVRILILLKIKR